MFGPKHIIIRTVTSTFVVRLLRSISRALILQSLLVSLVLSRLDYCNATLASLRSYLPDRLEIAVVMNVVKHPVYDHVTRLLRDLNWSCITQRIQFKQAVLAYR